VAERLIQGLTTGDFCISFLFLFLFFLLPLPITILLLSLLLLILVDIICPDNEVTWEVDQKRIQWAAEDLIKNRPALSRWHPDYAPQFQEFLKK